MKTLALAGISALALGACASLPPPPAADLPVVRYGDTAPAGKEFILHYPAGAKLPVAVAVSGSLLDTSAKETLSVSLKRDVYMKGPWVSFDGKTWIPGHDAVTGKIDFALPGVDDGRSPGRLGAEFNLKP
jgi:hypothetical protein